MGVIQKFAFVHQTAKENCLAYLAGIEPTMQDGKAIRVVIQEASHDRSIEQNSTSHLWYSEIAQQSGETPAEVKARCKLTHGVPILRQHEEFEAFYQAALAPLDYETRLEAIKYVDITSIMTVREMNQYMDSVFNEHSRQGYSLTVPDDRRYKDLA